MGDSRENPSTNGIIRHDSHMRKSGLTRLGIEPGSPWWENGLRVRGIEHEVRQVLHKIRATEALGAILPAAAGGSTPGRPDERTAARGPPSTPDENPPSRELPSVDDCKDGGKCHQTKTPLSAEVPAFEATSVNRPRVGKPLHNQAGIAAALLKVIAVFLSTCTLGWRITKEGSCVLQVTTAISVILRCIQYVIEIAQKPQIPTQQYTGLDNFVLRLRDRPAARPSLCYFICGCFLGWTSPSIPLLKDPARSPVGAIDSTQASWIVTSLMLGCLVGALPSGWLANKLGRKMTLLLVAAFFVAGWVLKLTAATVVTLYVARVVAGAGVGVCYAVLPMYVGEIAHPTIRGTLGAIMQVMHNSGSLFQNCVGNFVSYSTLGVVDLVVPLVFVAVFVFMPESPYFLLMRLRRRRAETELMRLRGTTEEAKVAEEIRIMTLSVEADRAKSSTFRELVGSRGNRLALVVVLGLVFLQQVSGIFVILSYSTEIFQESGSSFSAEVSAILLGVVQTGTVVVSMFVADIAGRRVLLLISVVGSAIALFVEGLYFYLKMETEADMAVVDWLPVTALILFLIAYSLGLGPLPMTIIGEVFPTNVKGMAATCGSLWLVIVACGVSRLYQVINDICGIYATFWVFSACCVVGIIFVAIMVPETKGKTLTEILQELHKGKYISEDFNIDECKTEKEN
ncbi:hypothetical protein PR048_016754 [Dryococelus australis]|uniref:Major facilitator superfamily (MFS) profile domain-containing protein n=1 Tax=Dryococelus australis TaxID=614101 RepID=A0ABQ9H7N2_9NEOP|nr:hypothetical protein PR048_016754 [Dryococelus australis]